VIRTVVVGHGLAGRHFHAPLIRRQPGMALHGVVARDPAARAEAVATWGGIVGYPDLDAALADPDVDLVVLATPHDLHPAQAVATLRAGKACVVDKVMALSTGEADAMIAARDASGKMLSVFHNRRWDWDFLTLRRTLAAGEIGRPLLVESSVCRFSAPRTWRGRAASAGTILHDWGAHLVDQALGLGLGPCRRVGAWLTEGVWEGVDSGGHGRIVMEFDGTLVQAETSRVCRIDRPRWWVVGSDGGFVKYGLDPQEDALRAGDLDAAREPEALRAIVRRPDASGAVVEDRVAPVRGSWDAYYASVVAHLTEGTPLAVTAESAREVVRVLDAAVASHREHRLVEGTWPGWADRR
jgi:scyllo-inositol 2-dehydrogenase (NADP+)